MSEIYVRMRELSEQNKNKCAVTKVVCMGASIVLVKRSALMNENKTK